MDTRGASVDLHAQGLADGEYKAGWPSGSTSTARLMRQLTLEACLSPHANTVRTNSPSSAVPASVRPTVAEPSATAANIVNTTLATSKALPTPAKRKLNLASPPPKPARKSAAHGGAKAHAKAPHSAAGREGAPPARPARGFPSGNLAGSDSGSGPLQPQRNSVSGAAAIANAGCRAAQPAGAAAAATVPAELDRVGGYGARVERSYLPPSCASCRGSEFVLDGAPADEEASGLEQQGESAGPTQELEEDIREGQREDDGRQKGHCEVVVPGISAAGLAAGLVEKAARRLMQRGLGRRSGAPRGGWAASDGERSSDDDAGGDVRLRQRSRSRVGDGDAPEELDAEVLGLRPGRSGQGQGYGTSDSAGADCGGGSAVDKGRGAVASAAMTRAGDRPVRLAAKMAKQRMKKRAAGIVGNLQTSASASGGVVAPLGFQRPAGPSGDAEEHDRSSADGVVMDRGLSGARVEDVLHTFARAPADAAAGAGSGRASSTLMVDALGESDAGGGSGCWRDDAGGGGIAGRGTRSGATGRSDDHSRGTKATPSSSLDLAATSHGTAAGAAAAAPLGAADDGSGWESEPGPQLPPPSLPRWNLRRPGYADLAEAVAYRAAVRRGELEAVEGLPSCWGAGLLGDKRVYCNIVLHGSAATVIQAAISAALQGKLGKLNDQKLVRLAQPEMLSHKQASSIRQQLEDRLRRAAAARMEEPVGAAGQGDGGRRRDWRTLTNVEVLENLPEIIPPSSKVEVVHLGDGGMASPWDDVPEMRGQASLRVKPGCTLGAGQVIGVYSGEGWLHADWQEQGLIRPQAEWDDTTRPCPYRFTGSRRLEFGRYAADCSLPEVMMRRYLSKLELPEPRLRALLEEEHSAGTQLFLTAARLGCPLAAANDPSRNLRAKCKAEADYREGGPNAELVSASVLGILPVLVMVATQEVQGPDHIMYAYGLSYWELHEEDVAHCREMEEMEEQVATSRRAEEQARAAAEAARAEAEAARKKEARQLRKRRKMKAALKRLRLAGLERAQAEAAARAEAEAARQREEEERLRRLAVERELQLQRLSVARPQQPPVSKANAKTLPSEPASPTRPSNAPERLDRHSPRGTRPQEAPGNGGGTRGRMGPAAAAAGAPAAAETLVAAGGDAAGGLMPLQGLGSPLGKRNRVEDAVAEAGLGSPMARHRAAAAPTQAAAQVPQAAAQAPQAAAAPLLPSNAREVRPPPPTPPSPSPEMHSEEVDDELWGTPAHDHNNIDGGEGSWGRDSDAGCDSTVGDSQLQDCVGVAGPISASAAGRDDGRGGVGCNRGDGDDTWTMGSGGGGSYGMAAAGPSPAAAATVDAGPGGAAAGRNHSRLMSKKTRKVFRAAAGVAGADPGSQNASPAVPSVAWRNPIGHAAPRLPPRPAGPAATATAAGAGSRGTGKAPGPSRGAPPGSKTGAGGAERRAAAGALDLAVAVEEAAARPLPASPEAQPQPQVRRGAALSPLQRDPDVPLPHERADAQPRAPIVVVPQPEQLGASLTRQRPPLGPPPSEQQQQQPRRGPRPRFSKRPQEKAVRPPGDDDDPTGRLRPIVSGLRGRPVQYRPLPRPTVIEVVDLVDDSDSD